MSTHLKDIIQKQLGAVEFNTHDPLIAHVAREKTPQLFEEKITPVTFPEQQGMFYIFNWRVYAFYEYTLMQEARGFRILRAMPIDKDKGFDSIPSRTLYGMRRIDLEKAGVDLHVLFAALGDPNELNHLFFPGVQDLYLYLAYKRDPNWVLGQIHSPEALRRIASQEVVLFHLGL